MKLEAQNNVAIPVTVTSEPPISLSRPCFAWRAKLEEAFPNKMAATAAGISLHHNLLTFSHTIQTNHPQNRKNHNQNFHLKRTRT